MAEQQWIDIRGERYALDQCGECGVWFIVPEVVHTNHRQHGGYSSCSNGHRWGWRTGAEKEEQERLRQERDVLRQDAARLEDELAAEKRRAEAAEKRVLQVRRRAAAGVCPCCQRTFQNVQSHMKTKHPGIVPIAQKTA